MKPKRNRVIVDIDDTCYSLNALLQQVAAERGTPYTDADLHDWSSAVKNAGGKDQFLANLDEAYQRSLKSHPYEGALEMCEHLAALGYELYYVTDRPLHHQALTEQWLVAAGFPQPHNLHVCDDKRREIASLGKETIATIIDDRPRTLIWARYELALEHVFALRHPYNKAVADIPGVHLADDWHELSELIDRHLLAPARIS